MPTTTSVHILIKAALVTEFGEQYALDWPADELPKSADGLIAQAVVILPEPGVLRSVRASGGSSGRDDTARLYCVGPTRYDVLAVVDRVRGAVFGLRTSAKGGVLREAIAQDMGTEPNTDPVRHLVYLEYTTVTKG